MGKMGKMTNPKKILLIATAILSVLASAGYWAYTRVESALSDFSKEVDLSPQKGALAEKYKQIKSRLNEMTQSEVESIFGKPDIEGSNNDPEAVAWILSKKGAKAGLGGYRCQQLWIRFKDGQVVSFKEVEKTLGNGQPNN